MLNRFANPKSMTGVWLALGIALGISFSYAFNNLAIGIPMGPFSASRSGDNARACCDPNSIASTDGAAITAGPVRMPWLMKSRRLSGRLWPS